MLRVAENTNDGWRATLGGRQLETVVLDGWQQGYVVPAGDGGRVTLTFTPDATYRAGLLFGLIVAALLVLAAGVGQLLERRRREAPPAVATHAAARPPGWPARSAGGLGLLVLGGPVAFVAFCLPAFARGRAWVAWVGAAAVLASAVVAAVVDGTSRGVPGGLSDWLAAAGVGLLTGAALWVSAGSRRRPRWSPRTPT